MPQSPAEPVRPAACDVAWLTRHDTGSGQRVASRLHGARVVGVHSPQPLVPPTDAPVGGELPHWNLGEFLQQVRDRRLTVLVDSSWTDAPLVEQLANAGVALWLESAVEWPETWLAALHRLSHQTGSPLITGFPLRCRPDVVEVHQALATGSLGDPGVLRLHDWQSPPTPGKSSSPDRSGESSPAAPGSRPQVSNADAATLDLGLWLLDALPEIVWASRPSAAGNSHPDPEQQAHAASPLLVHLGFASGAMALIDRASLPGDQPPYFSLSVIGTRGAAYADDHHNRQLLLTERGPVAVASPWGDAPRRMSWQSLVDASREPGASDRRERELQRLARVLAGVRESLVSGRAVRLVD